MTIPFNFSFWAEYQPPIVTTGLYAYFDGSNPASLPTSATTGSIWTSISGTSTGTTGVINSVISGPAVSYTSSFQGGLNFAPATGHQGVSVNKLLFPSSGTTDWTYETWINTATGTTGLDALYAVGSNTCRIINGSNDQKIYVNPYSPSSYGEIGSGVTNGQNIHIVVTYNYTTKETKCYVNSVLQTQVLSPVWTYSITQTFSTLGIGASLAGRWLGTMYKVRTYAGILTASQVENNWNAEKQQYGYY
jgi:hypothetical protein